MPEIAESGSGDPKDTRATSARRTPAEKIWDLPNVDIAAAMLNTQLPYLWRFHVAETRTGM